MNITTNFIAAIPVLASLDMERSAEFFVAKLGFTKVHVAARAYGIVSNGPVEIHLWACAGRLIAQATSCRAQVRLIEQLHQHCQQNANVHPKAQLEIKP